MRPEACEAGDSQTGVQIQSGRTVGDVTAGDLSYSIQPVVQRAAVDVQTPCRPLDLTAAVEVALQSRGKFDALRGGQQPLHSDRKMVWCQSVEGQLKEKAIETQILPEDPPTITLWFQTRCAICDLSLVVGVDCLRQ
jgi:hypothetical protein